MDDYFASSVSVFNKYTREGSDTTIRLVLGSAATAIALAAAPAEQANDFFPDSSFLTTSPFSLESHGNVGAQNTTIEGNRGTNPLGSLPETGEPITVSAGGFSVSQAGVANNKFIAWCLDTLRAGTLSTSTYTINNANPFTNTTGPDLSAKRGTIEDLFNRAYELSSARSPP
jgi:hypothetical protein